ARPHAVQARLTGRSRRAIGAAHDHHPLLADAWSAGHELLTADVAVVIGIEPVEDCTPVADHYTFLGELLLDVADLHYRGFHFAANGVDLVPGDEAVVVGVEPGEQLADMIGDLGPGHDVITAEHHAHVRRTRRWRGHRRGRRSGRDSGRGRGRRLG